MNKLHAAFGNKSKLFFGINIIKNCTHQSISSVFYKLLFVWLIDAPTISVSAISFTAFNNFCVLTGLLTVFTCS